MAWEAAPPSPGCLPPDGGLRNKKGLPHLTVPQVLLWADAYHSRTGAWPQPKKRPGGIPGTNGETWLAVDSALRVGLRGLLGGSSLPQVLVWADAHHAAHGEWPTCRYPQQAIPGMEGERWFNVDQALRKGLRGLPGGLSLPKLLAKHRGASNLKKSMAARMPGGKHAAFSSPI